MMKALKITGIILGIFILIGIVGVSIFNRGQSDILKMKINDIDLTKVSDGNYTGVFDGYRWSNTVEVTVFNHKITNISFVKKQEVSIKDIEDALISRVIEKQSVKVDTVSGGTLSSKAILKAIENAFNK